MPSETRLCECGHPNTHHQPMAVGWDCRTPGGCDCEHYRRAASPESGTTPTREEWIYHPECAMTHRAGDCPRAASPESVPQEPPGEPDAVQALHAAASDLRHFATKGGMIALETLKAHADNLLVAAGEFATLTASRDAAVQEGERREAAMEARALAAEQRIEAMREKVGTLPAPFRDSAGGYVGERDPDACCDLVCWLRNALSPSPETPTP